MFLFICPPAHLFTEGLGKGFGLAQQAQGTGNNVVDRDDCPLGLPGRGIPRDRRWGDSASRRLFQGRTAYHRHPIVGNVHWPALLRDQGRSCIGVGQIAPEGYSPLRTLLARRRAACWSMPRPWRMRVLPHSASVVIQTVRERPCSRYRRTRLLQATHFADGGILTCRHGLDGQAHSAT